MSDASISNSIGNFAELVAAGTPTPGGGSVSAYCGVLAASLGQMVCSITIGKPKYAAVEPRLKEIKSELERLSARLQELIAEDAASFEAVLAAYRLPKETVEQKAERAAMIERAVQGAIDVPSETARRSFDVLKLLGEVAEIGTPNALSDVAVGAQLSELAIRGASYNIVVNLDSLSDRDAADKTRHEIDAVVHQAVTIADQVAARMKI
jgi:formiminotetrahydrofolate cyclodeaminase